jgi:hypothetical protein
MSSDLTWNKQVIEPLFEREQTVGIPKKIIPGDKKPSNKKMLISQLYNLNLAMLIQIWAPQTIELIK